MMAEEFREEEDLIDDEDALDAFHSEQPVPPNDDTLPAPVTRTEIRLVQRMDECYQNLLSSAIAGTGKVRESPNGVLVRTHPDDESQMQVILPATLQPRILSLEHLAPLAGHPDPRCMFEKIWGTFYWPQMAADVAATARNGPQCANKRVACGNAQKHSGSSQQQNHYEA